MYEVSSGQRTYGENWGSLRGRVAHMVQTPPITTISERYNNFGIGGKEKLRLLQRFQGWKSDRMQGMPSEPLGLKHFKGCV